ncbi:phage head morphogenesis, SPP1 gp7 family domain protein [Xenorhabdus ehlersii]|uniref:Phage head morphogenesis, SPP1 gp7 family domain protein n=3 Tax=Xenorhabdus ehlersii TaxID=290111 RepID=A0A2D0IL88_9GAMM|nr:phage head morphogenesis, SPP1 gp7 family domain protein [Xenorhabdus ehlersii]
MSGVVFMPTRNKTNLGYVIGLPPKEAIDYFQRKGFAIGFNWHEVEALAHARAFTVAGVLKLDVLADIRTELQKSLETGQTFRDFQRNLLPMLERKGWLGKGLVADTETGELHGKRLTPRRLETIFTTNMQSAYMAGRYQQQMENVDDRPYWERVGIMDSRIRPSHAALDGFIARYDDPIWQSIYPPDGYRCRCRVRTRSAADVERLGLRVQSTEGRRIEVQQEYGEPGETRPVMGFENPMTGKVYAPDPGFGFNPGQVSWQPELDKYPQPAASQYVTGTLTGPDFIRVFNEALKQDAPSSLQRYPVAVRPRSGGLQSDPVTVDAPTLKRLADKARIDLADYLALQQIIEHPERQHLAKDGTQYYGAMRAGVWWIVSVREGQLRNVIQQADFHVPD